MTSVLVLGGGPDAEREVSITSAKAIHQGCLDAGLNAELLIIDLPDIDEVKTWKADVIFPALHGQFGEGGRLQAMLEEAGHTFVGNRSRASRLAMDKMGTKLVALRCGLLTPAACVICDADLKDPACTVCPFELPVVIKPIADGSSFGLSMCYSNDEWIAGLEQAKADIERHPGRVYMIERLIEAREFTVSVLEDDQGELKALPIVEIAPASGVYDFESKYEKNDTIYTVEPELPDGMADQMAFEALRVCMALGIEHLGRVDFLGCPDGHTTMLEVNTMPGFTPNSLFPMAAKADGFLMASLCEHLVGCAVRSGGCVQGT